MSKSEELQALQEQLAKELPAFIACSVVSAENGLPLAGTVFDSNLDLSVPAGAFTEAFKVVVKAYEYSDWGLVNELLFSGEKSIVILFSLKGGKFYEGVAIRSTATLGIIKAIFNKYKEPIEKLL
jgi:predicted regulator of Ras-like GTPase activity (Roadblock/LC7/MglB family)